jgi:uncharacterized protein YggE
MRIPLPAVVLLFAPVALAQSPLPEKGTVTAEATEVVRGKPDLAKLYFHVLVKNADATTATDEAAEQAKQFTAALDKLGLSGVKVSALPQRVTRVETQNRNVPNAVFNPEYHAARTVLVSVTAKDPDKLFAAVEKVQAEAARQGVAGESSGNASYNGFTYERNAPVRVVFARDGGWEADTAKALAAATKKAVARAAAMAEGAGLKAGEVVSIGEPPAAVIGTQTIYNYAGVSGAAVAGMVADPQDEFVDGELVRKVRVRVVMTVGK